MIPKVSVIIPVYNVEQYLGRCVNSVFAQTMDNLEIILVDDGSPDNCPYICDGFRANDSRVKVIHKKNGGLASARNAGMSIAVGEYIFFLDSDDWLEPDGLEHLYGLAKEYNVDFVRYRSFRTGWPGMPENTPCMLEPAREIPGGLYDKSKIEKDILPKMLVTAQLTFSPVLGAWGGLYKHSFLKENNICFYEDIRYSEDVLFSANVIRKASSFYYDDNAGVYHYFYNPNSISKSFKPDRWEACKSIVNHAYEDFSGDKNFDFSIQLNRLTWFCILLGLGERHNITDKKQRNEYCKRIMTDNMVKQCVFKPKWYAVSKKQKILMRIIKNNLWWIISEV